MAPTNRIARGTTLGLCLVALAAIARPALAQKTAYVASEEILGRMTEVKDARAKLAETQATWMREIQQQELEIARQRSEMEANRLLWSVQERRDAESRLKELEQKLTKFRSSKYDKGGEYETMHGEMLTPLYDRVFAAINEEAKAQKYDFVFDKSSRGMPMLFANPDYDLTYAVLKRLGVTVEAPEEGTDTTSTDPTAEDGASPRRGRRPAEDPNTVLDPIKEEPDASTR